MNSAEYVVWGTNGPRPTDAIDGECLPGAFEESPPRDREHITQKPLQLLRQLVQIAPRGGKVIDPFAGSGTTAEACEMEGRSFLGFEIEKHFADVSERRIESTQSTPGLFRAANGRASG